jgi:hypothetical protein
MAFVKLDSGMLRSTTWIDKDARDVFITALLLAEPQEFTEPVKQLKVSSLDETGWAAPPGWYGFVPASGPGLAHLASVQLQDAYAALDRLGSPEPESRSQDYAGRRMIRIDGGYLVLNFAKYRDKDHTTAERSRRYRASRSSRVTSSRHGVTGRDVTQAEAEAEAENKSPVVPLEGDPPKKGKRARRGTISHFVPETWGPHQTHRSKANSRSEEWFAKQVEDFRNWEFKTPRSDWDRAFHIWLNKSLDEPVRGKPVRREEDDAGYA